MCEMKSLRQVANTNINRRHCLGRNWTRTCCMLSYNCETNNVLRLPTVVKIIQEINCKVENETKTDLYINLLQNNHSGLQLDDLEDLARLQVTLMNVSSLHGIVRRPNGWSYPNSASAQLNSL